MEPNRLAGEAKPNVVDAASSGPDQTAEGHVDRPPTEPTFARSSAKPTVGVTNPELPGPKGNFLGWSIAQWLVGLVILAATSVAALVLVAALTFDYRSSVRPTSAPSPASVELYDPATGVFSPTGSLKTPRDSATATLLPDGHVLLAGGDTNGSVLASAELYNSTAGTFNRTGSLVTPRNEATATLLAGGLVLIVGGATDDERQGGAATSLASAELYDPATGAFGPTGPLATARTYATATLLPDGRVLIAGGYTPTDTGIMLFASAELYDPSTGTFSPTGSLATARSNATAILLPDGLILVAGGYTDALNAAAELYDPKTGSFSLTGLQATASADATATLLPDGRILIAGGDSGGTSLSSAELYDPTTGKFSPTGSLATARDRAVATLLPDGQVLVAGGYNGTPAGGDLVASAEVYDPKTGLFSPTGSLASGRRSATATLLPDGQVLIAGGYNGG